MTKVYTVTMHTWESEYRANVNAIIRVCDNLDKAIKFVADITRFPYEDIVAGWSDGWVDVEYWDKVYTIEEHILE